MVVLSLLGIGCGNRDSVDSRTAGPETREDPVVIALSRLERTDDAAICLAALQAIDTIGNPRQPKPQPTQAELAPLAGLLKLDARDADSLAQPIFTNVDADYLAECFLHRDAVRSLQAKDAPPLGQAEVAFDWVCRQIHLGGIVRDPAPPWWVLQAGSGSGLDRAYAFLGLLHQLGIDGCLIGPPSLAKSPSRDLEKGTFAPIRAVGARIDGQVHLFDPWQGKAVAHDGKVVTLAQLRADSAPFDAWLKKAGIAEDEVARWEVFLAPAGPALSPRMEWLERQMPPANAVRLYLDLPATIGRFQQVLPKGTPCRVWNPENDGLSPLWLHQTYAREVKGPDGSLIQPNKLRYRLSHAPNRFVPQLIVQGQPLVGKPRELILSMFHAEFENSLIRHQSARDNLLRGNFGNAVSALTDQKDRNDRMRDRVARETDLDKAVAPWAQQANEIFANIERARLENDDAALTRAQNEQANFLKSPLSDKMGFLLRRQTSELLSAEATYLLALVMHERAERAATRWRLVRDDKSRSEAASLWQNAADAWQRYLDNYPELQGKFDDRDSHARALQDRCRAEVRSLASK